uniref:Uncharacterized protein n=1 Tax=Astyanax mexicanus TaxID=7994 RepID=A0A3B1K4G6_ASTMX
MVMDGVSFPSLKSVSLSILEGSLGLGSLGVPSTLAHLPIVLSQPTILFNTQCDPATHTHTHSLFMMDSLTRTPAPIVTPVPIDTFGPNCGGNKKRKSKIIDEKKKPA